MILVDANILMYAEGGEHTHRKHCIAFLEKVLRGFVSAAIDAEVLQEILHRHRSVDRWSTGLEAYNDARVMFPDTLAITTEVMDSARDLMATHAQLGARDAVHAAVVRVYAMESICSYDKDFDRIPGIKRIEPRKVL